MESQRTTGDDVGKKRRWLLRRGKKGVEEEIKEVNEWILSDDWTGWRRRLRSHTRVLGRYAMITTECRISFSVVTRTGGVIHLKNTTLNTNPIKMRTLTITLTIMQIKIEIANPQHHLGPNFISSHNDTQEA